MKQQITYTLSCGEIETIVREKLNERGFKNIDEIIFEFDHARPILKDALECKFTADEEDLGENYSLLPKEKSPDEVAREKLLATPLKEIDLSVRAYNALKFTSVKNLGDILSLYKKDNNWYEIRQCPNIGDKTINTLIELLKEKGLI